MLNVARGAFIVHPISSGIQEKRKILRGKSRLVTSCMSDSAIRTLFPYLPIIACKYGRLTGAISRLNGRELVMDVHGVPFDSSQIGRIDMVSGLLIETPEAKAIAKAAQARIGATIRYCHKKGASIVGLGAFSSRTMCDPKYEIHLKEYGITGWICSGNALTAGIGADAGILLLKEVGISAEEAVVLVLGIGSVGGTMAHLFAKRAGTVLIYARQTSKLEKLKEEIYQATGKTCVVVTPDNLPIALAQADLVVTATSEIKSDGQKFLSCKQGAIIYDLGRPHNVDFLYLAQERPDLLVIEGGLLAVPGRATLSCDIHLPRTPRVLVPACFAETCVRVWDGPTQHYSAGRIGIEEVEEVRQRCYLHGFKLASWRIDDEEIPLERIKLQKQIIGERNRLVVRA